MLQRSRAYATDAPIGLIGATADPRAIRTYAQLPGFRTLPALAAMGTVRGDRLDRTLTTSVRDGDDADLAEGAALDRRLRRGQQTLDGLEQFGAAFSRFGAAMQDIVRGATQGRPKKEAGPDTRAP